MTTGSGNLGVLKSVLMTFQVAAKYCSNPNVFPTAPSAFIVQNNISRKVESSTVKSKVESSMSTLVKVESSMVENKVKVESNMVGLTIFNQKMKMGDELQIKAESSGKRKSLRLNNKVGPDEKRRLIG